ncbi:cordon-bleu protein-like 1 isoform X2 [Paramormyrops kingsleyae]|uniref:cordon-bleu protein-like 1 isoform X2 n=1 Tax=Paramormyrops kingsleyae TaxID=1676925 RepID=UPI003B9702F8
MDEHPSRSTLRPQSSLRSSKRRAPPVPPAATCLDGPQPPQGSLGFPQAAMDQKENLGNRELKLAVVLPGGVEKTAIINGSEPVMDLLVTLCAQYRLNPSGHTIELISANRNDIKFKPNSLMGSLEAEKILIKPKGAEDRNKKTGPHLPEATVRLIINHKKTQKTILRVSPQAPLESLVPAICEKCEFNPKTTLLLRDVNSEEPLDLTRSLNDYGLRELYARDIKGGVNAYFPASSVDQEERNPPVKGEVLKDKENRGLFGSLFRKSKKKTEQAVPTSAATSPVLARKRPESMTIAPSYSSSTNVSKKRRAPAPPVTPAHLPQSDLSQQETPAKLGVPPEGRQERGRLMRGLSEISLRSTKRKAPPPPRAVTVDETSLDRSIKGVPPPQPSSSPGIVGETHNGDHSPRRSASVVEKCSPDTMYIEMQGCSPLEGTTQTGPGGPSSDGKEAGIAMNHKESCEKALNTDEAVNPELEVMADDNNEQEKASQGQILELVGDENKSITREPIDLPPLAHESPTLPCPKLQPTSQEVGVQALDPLSTGTLDTDHPGSVKAPTSSSSDAPPPTPPELPKTPPSSGFSSIDRPQLKRDMSTSTEEGGPDPVQSGAAHQAQTITVTKQPLVQVKDSKPSIELTRDCTPKVGLTSYTVKPSKSVDKLRFFEVELTLEAPGPDVPSDASKSLSEHVAPFSKTTKPQDSGDKPELYSLSLRDNLQLHNGTHNNTASSPRSTAEQDEPFPERPLPRVEGASADAPQVGKKNKVPPPVRPKPAAFRLSLQKRTSGYYVTSAAEKDAITSSRCSAGGRDHPEKAVCDNGFPPPPPPVFWDEEAGGDPQETSPQTSVPRPSRQSSTELSLEKLRSFAAPKPFIAAAPSPFARAVAMAVKRSNSLNQDSLSPTPSSPTDLTFVVEQKDSSGNVGSAPLWSSTENAMEPQEAEIPSPGWNGEPANHPEMATGAGETLESPLQL